MASLFDQRLWIVSGKGGVGKSTVSAGLALASAQAGRKTLVCELNVQERIAPSLGHAPAGPELKQIEKNLWAVNILPADAMREYALLILRFESLYKAVFENRLVRQFLRFIPSLQELVMLGKVLYHVQEKQPDGQWRYDTVVVDAPSTGHALSLLRLPQVLLDTVPPGPLATESEKMRDLLVDPNVTAAVCVSIPEEMPVNETLELVEGLKTRARVSPRAIVLNQHVASRFSADDLARLQSHPKALQLAQIHEARASASAQAMTALERARLPIFTLPFLPARSVGRTELLALIPLLEPLWRGT